MSSVINLKQEDCIRTTNTIAMEEGDSSLEPGEVKTPPHDVAGPTNKHKVTDDHDDDGDDETNVKSSKIQYSSQTQSASKQETDKCAEKVRAILELDALRRKEELERKKEQKSDDTLVRKNKTKKKEHKKQKSSKRDKTTFKKVKESRKRKSIGNETEKGHEPVKKKLKHKKKKHDEHKKSYSSSHSPKESYESMRSTNSSGGGVGGVSLPIISPLEYSTPMMNVGTHFSRGFPGYNTHTSYRPYKPFMKNYRNDFRHRGNDFTPHNRSRFPRYRSQYKPQGFGSGSFHVPADEEAIHSPPLPTNSEISYAHTELMWTKTKPSISFAYISLKHDTTSKKEKKSSERSSEKKKKPKKKSKEREHSNRSSTSSKLSRKSSKRKKIRHIRETLQSHKKKRRTISPPHNSSTTPTGNDDDDDANTPDRENNTPETVKEATENINTPVQSPYKSDKLNQKDEKTEQQVPTEKIKVGGEKTDDPKKSQVLDMFASLTPPKQQSPPAEPRSLTSSNISSNIQITNKLQEIQYRIDKLLEDDDLKLEAIKEKLLQQKSREHVEQAHKNKSKKTYDKDISLSPHRDKTFDIKQKQRSKDNIGSISKDSRKHYNTEEDRDLTPPPGSLQHHSKDLHNTTPHTTIKVKQEKRESVTPPKEKPWKEKQIIKIKTEKMTPPPLRGNSPSSNLENAAIKCRTTNGSPNTDDYSDNWENDDEEVDVNAAILNPSISKNGINNRDFNSSPALSFADSANSETHSKIQSTTPTNSPPPQILLSPKVIYTQNEQSPKVSNNEKIDDMQILYNQFIKSVESANVKLSADEKESSVDGEKRNKEHENEHLSTSSTSYSSSSSSSSDTSVSSSTGSSSGSSSSDSASEDSNDTDMSQNIDKSKIFKHDNISDDKNASSTNDASINNENTMTTKDDDGDMKTDVVKDLKKLENLEANLLRIQMMRANYDSADEISDELLKMEKLFLHEKKIILNKFADTSTAETAANNNKVIKSEKETDSGDDIETPLAPQPSTSSTEEFSYLQSRGQFVPSMQNLANISNDTPPPQVSNIFNIKRDVIKLTISPVKLPKIPAIFEADNDVDNTKETTAETTENTEKSSNKSTSTSGTTVKQQQQQQQQQHQHKPIKEVAIVKPIMESKETSSTHHHHHQQHHQQQQQKHQRRRSPLSTSHHTINRSRSRSRRRGRVRSLSVSPSRNSNSSRSCLSPQRRTAGGGGSGSGSGFSKQSRNRNFDRRSRSRSTSANRRRSGGDISPIMRKRRPPSSADDRFRKHSPRRGDLRTRSHSRSRSRTRSRTRSPQSRHRSDRYSRSPLPFKPPSPPTDPNNLSPNNTNIRRSSLSPDRHSPHSPHRRNHHHRHHSPSSSMNKLYDSSDNRHRSLSPKQRFYNQQLQQHSPPNGSTSNNNNNNNNSLYYFNNSPSRISSLDARINFVLSGPHQQSTSNHNENTQTLVGYDDYSHYGQYAGPAAYMSLPNDPNAFYTNQYVPMTNNTNAAHNPAHPHSTTVQPIHYTNLPIPGNDDTNLYATMQQHATANNASNYYYNRFGTQPPYGGLNQPSPLLKELPKASTVAVQKGNVLEIVPCSDIIASSCSISEQNQNENETKKGNTNDESTAMEDPNTSKNDKNKRSILKPLDGETNTVRPAVVATSKPKKKVNFEDGVYPNYNSDEEDRKVIEAKIRIKMRRLRKKLGITPQCQRLLEEKVRKNKQEKKDKKVTPPPPPPPTGGVAPPNLEQPIYLRTHTPTPLLYFHFDGVVHSMYVSQMERPIPPRLLNQKCLAPPPTTNNNNNISLAAAATGASHHHHHIDSQSPSYMQSPINAAAAASHKNKDPIAAFTRPNRNENLSPKILNATALQQQQQQATNTGSPKLSFKLYSPIDSSNISSNIEIGNATLSNTSPNNIKLSNTIQHTATAITAIPSNQFMPSKQRQQQQQQQESLKDMISTSRNTNISMGLLPIPHLTTHVPMTHIAGIVTTPTPQARIPVIGVPPTVIPKAIPTVSEPFMGGGGFTTTTLQQQTSSPQQHYHHQQQHQHQQQQQHYHAMKNPNQNYQMVPTMAHINNLHNSIPSPSGGGGGGGVIGVQPYFNAAPIQRTHRQLPNYGLVQQSQSSPTSLANLPMCHMVDNNNTDTSTNADNMDKFNSPQNMTIPFGYKGP